MALKHENFQLVLSLQNLFSLIRFSKFPHKLVTCCSLRGESYPMHLFYLRRILRLILEEKLPPTGD